MGIISLLNFQRSKSQQDVAATAFLDEDPIQGLCDLYVPEDELMAEEQERDIAEVLVELGKISCEQRDDARARRAQSSGLDIESILLSSSMVDSISLTEAKAVLHNVEFRRITPEDVTADAFKKLDIDFIREFAVCPISIDNKTLLVATNDPANVFLVEDVKKKTQMQVQSVICPIDDIYAICEAFEKIPAAPECTVNEIISDMAELELVQDEVEECEDLEQMAGQSPVIKFVNFLISNAINEGASDIHIEPKEKHTRVRYRIDGVLFDSTQAPMKMHPAIVSRIKIMANLDISERRLPQDGKIAVIVGGRAIDLRVSTLPTNHGEKVVIRVLDSRSIMRGLNQLGMEQDVEKEFAEQIAMPHGILLVTGPTGSGKSTTLYSALPQMDGDRLNISTVEDPVEYQLEFCNQIQTNEKIGMTFAAALRSLLRQDPDVIMVGEIRDNETARVAVQAALTGHLVLSTLHTNDAPSSITRLVNIGIDAYLVAASLNAVVAQRLVRRLCPNCKEQYVIPENMRKYVERTGIKPEELMHGKGCDKCRNSGYSGRVGIYELLVVDDRIRDTINRDHSSAAVRKAFIKSGRDTLFDDGVKKVKSGLTTLEEVLRVTEVYGKTQDEVFEENA